MPRSTLCASWIYILEGGESAIMLHIPPVVCVSWGPGSWRDVSHTDLPSHNKGEEFYEYFGDKEEHQGDFPLHGRKLKDGTMSRSALGCAYMQWQQIVSGQRLVKRASGKAGGNSKLEAGAG